MAPEANLRDFVEKMFALAEELEATQGRISLEQARLAQLSANLNVLLVDNRPLYANNAVFLQLIEQATGNT